MSEMQQGRCQWCLEWFGVKPDGLINRHKWHSELSDTTYCPGSGFLHLGASSCCLDEAIKHANRRAADAAKARDLIAAWWLKRQSNLECELQIWKLEEPRLAAKKEAKVHREIIRVGLDGVERRSAHCRPLYEGLLTTDPVKVTCSKCKKARF